VTCLLGRNGSGKTTLMRIAAGDLRADFGTVFFGDVARERPSLARAAREGLMYLPQEQLLMPRRRVEEHFAALAAVFGAESLAEAIREVRIEALFGQRVASLSRGERVRVSLGLALARRPRVLIADEPLVGLAPNDQETFGAVLRRLAGRGTAVVTSGHDARVLLSISDVILWSVAGSTHHLGSPAEALRHEQFRREYLGPSATR
jgi:ABC-type multidrug transport system ATPase subunit